MRRLRFGWNSNGGDWLCAWRAGERERPEVDHIEIISTVRFLLVAISLWYSSVTLRHARRREQLILETTEYDLDDLRYVQFALGRERWRWWLAVFHQVMAVFAIIFPPVMEDRAIPHLHFLTEHLVLIVVACWLLLFSRSEYRALQRELSS
jgi:hypothetical protein